MRIKESEFVLTKNFIRLGVVYLGGSLRVFEAEELGSHHVGVPGQVCVGFDHGEHVSLDRGRPGGWAVVVFLAVGLAAATGSVSQFCGAEFDLAIGPARRELDAVLGFDIDGAGVLCSGRWFISSAFEPLCFGRCPRGIVLAFVSRCGQECTGLIAVD